jgi:copper chaperone CopZ
MQRFLGVVLGVASVLGLAGAAPADTTVEIKGVHLCCPACVAAVGKIVKEVEGVKAACNQQKSTVTLTAADEKTIQKAVDALAAGGFHGNTGSKDVTFKDDSGVEKGKVKSLTVTGVHNCCGQCNNKIKATLKKVDGVTGDTAKPRENTFEVTGDFDAGELVKALNAAGFHVKVKK